MEDTGGIDLSFGNAESMVKMVEMIGERQGFGNVLAEGSERAAKIIGKGAEDFLITSKGLEAPAHMPQAKRMMGLIYAVNPFGADHESSEHDPFIEQGSADDLARGRIGELGFTQLQEPGGISDEKVRFVAKTQQVYSALDTYALCSFVWGVGWQLYGPQDMVDVLRFATGWDITLDELLLVGERRINMMRLFNAREGLTRENDTLQKKFFKPLQGTGPTAGVHYSPEQFEHMKDAYYGYAGWDPVTGNPTPEKLAALGLDWVEL
jgi:aldehyde:ferredoxin oxidoreductase